MTLQKIYDLIYNYQLYIYNCEDYKTIEKMRIKIVVLKQKAERMLKLNRILGIQEKYTIKTLNIENYIQKEEMVWVDYSNKSNVDWTF